MQYYKGGGEKVNPETDQELTAWFTGRKFQLSRAGDGYRLLHRGKRWHLLCHPTVTK